MWRRFDITGISSTSRCPIPHCPALHSESVFGLQHDAIRRNNDDALDKSLIRGTFYHGHTDSGSPGRYKTDGEGSCCSWHVHPAWRGPRGIHSPSPLKPYRRCNLPPNPCHAIRSGAYRDRLPLPIWVGTPFPSRWEASWKSYPGICSCPDSWAFLPGTPQLLGKIPIASFPVSSSVSQALRSSAFHSSVEGCPDFIALTGN